MSSGLVANAVRSTIEGYFNEDDLSRNLYYINSLPSDMVRCSLKIKDNMVLSGLPYFVEVFKYLGDDSLSYDFFKEYEGQEFRKDDKSEIQFELPFAIALTGERIALNLLQHSSAISTYTKKFVRKVEGKDIAILDTRKTTPGHRSLEKYAVRVGGGFNHRLGQTDLWMVKDNHKSFFGGVENAVSFFRGMKGFYTPIEVEVHSIQEFEEVLKMGVKHIMLDNFSPEDIRKVINRKPVDVTIEVSGGVRLSNIDDYLIKGVDAISIGALTYGAPSVDISLKYKRV
jgi:nicotinate-nucleotide pyrophosphorylase (carboxylating)